MHGIHGLLELHFPPGLDPTCTLAFRTVPRIRLRGSHRELAALPGDSPAQGTLLGNYIEEQLRRGISKALVSPGGGVCFHLPIPKHRKSRLRLLTASHARPAAASAASRTLPTGSLHFRPLPSRPSVQPGSSQRRYHPGPPARGCHASAPHRAHHVPQRCYHRRFHPPTTRQLRQSPQPDLETPSQVETPPP